MHQSAEQAAKLGREGKPESYYFPPQLNWTGNNFPHTFMGLEPGTTKEDIRKCLERWNEGDNGILDFSKAYRLKPGTGWLIPPCVLHAPGSLVTYEPQWGSDVFGMYQSMVEGRRVPWELLVKDVPEDKHHDLDYLVEQLDWEKNVDPEFKAHNYLEPIVHAGSEAEGLRRQVDRLRDRRRPASLQRPRADRLSRRLGHHQGRRRLRPGLHPGPGDDRQARDRHPGLHPLRRGDEGRGLRGRQEGQGRRDLQEHRHRAVRQPPLLRPGRPSERPGGRGSSQGALRDSTMSIATAETRSPPAGEQHFVLDGIGYDGYVAINDALGEGRRVRLIYVDGRLTFLTASRRHEWFAKRLAEIVKAVASATRDRWEDAGSATYRRRDREVGVEGDETFYLGAHAELMRGPVNIDLSTQPPPDLAIEVEVTHPADDALLRLRPARRARGLAVRRRGLDASRSAFGERTGPIERSNRGQPCPWLEAADVLDQLATRRRALGARWSAQLTEWVRVTILPPDGRGLRAMDDRSPPEPDDLPEDLLQPRQARATARRASALGVRRPSDPGRRFAASVPGRRASSGHVACLSLGCAWSPIIGPHPTFALDRGGLADLVGVIVGRRSGS